MIDIKLPEMEMELRESKLGKLEMEMDEIEPSLLGAHFNWIMENEKRKRLRKQRRGGNDVFDELARCELHWNDYYTTRKKLMDKWRRKDKQSWSLRCHYLPVIECDLKYKFRLNDLKSMKEMQQE